MQIYRLRPILDDPRYQGFGWELPGLTNEHGRTYDFTHFFPTSDSFKVPSLKRKWDTPTFTHQENVSPFNDFPCCDFHVPVFSQRAAEVLRNFLEPNGELLPVNAKYGTYFAYQTMTIADGVLNKSKTEGIPLDEFPQGFFDISVYSFFKTKLDEYSVFRVREKPSEILVSEEVKIQAEANRLLGFFFDPIWSSDGGAMDGIKLDKKRSEKAQSKTLVLHLAMSDDSVTKSERAKIRRLRRKLNDDIVVRDVEEEYVGSLAGEEIEDGWIKIFMPCPEPEILLERIRNTLTSFVAMKKRLSLRDAPYWVDAEDLWLD